MPRLSEDEEGRDKAAKRLRGLRQQCELIRRYRNGATQPIYLVFREGSERGEPETI